MSTSAEAYYYDVLRRATIERLRAMLYAWDLPKYGTKEAMTSRIFLHVLARGLATGSTSNRHSSTLAGVSSGGVCDIGSDDNKVKVLRDAERDYQARWAHLREWPVHPSPDQLRSVVEQSKVTARAASKKSRARKEREREREREREMGERFGDDEADADVDVSDGADIDAGVDAGDVAIAAAGTMVTGVVTGTGTGTGTTVPEVKVEDREREVEEEGEEGGRKRKRSAVEMDISAGASVGMTQGRNHAVNVYGKRRNSGAGPVGIGTGGTGNGFGPSASNGRGGGANRGLQNINHVIPHPQQQQQVHGGRHRMAAYPSPPLTLTVDEESVDRPRRGRDIDVNVVDNDDGGGERTPRMLVNKAAAGTTGVDREMVLLEQMCRIREMIAQEEKREKPCMAVLAVYNAQLHKRMQRLNREA